MTNCTVCQAREGRTCVHCSNDRNFYCSAHMRMHKETQLHNNNLFKQYGSYEEPLPPED